MEKVTRKKTKKDETRTGSRTVRGNLGRTVSDLVWPVRNLMTSRMEKCQGSNRAKRERNINKAQKEPKENEIKMNT